MTAVHVALAREVADRDLCRVVAEFVGEVFDVPRPHPDVVGRVVDPLTRLGVRPEGARDQLHGALRAVGARPGIAAAARLLVADRLDDREQVRGALLGHQSRQRRTHTRLGRLLPASGCAVQAHGGPRRGALGRWGTLSRGGFIEALTDALAHLPGRLLDHATVALGGHATGPIPDLVRGNDDRGVRVLGVPRVELVLRLSDRRLVVVQHAAGPLVHDARLDALL